MENNSLDTKVFAMCQAHKFISASEIEWILRNDCKCPYKFFQIENAIKRLCEKKLIKISAPGFPLRYGTSGYGEKGTDNYEDSENGDDKVDLNEPNDREIPIPPPPSPVNFPSIFPSYVEHVGFTQ